MGGDESEKWEREVSGQATTTGVTHTTDWCLFPFSSAFRKRRSEMSRMRRGPDPNPGFVPRGVASTDLISRQGPLEGYSHKGVFRSYIDGVFFDISAFSSMNSCKSSGTSTSG